MFCENCGMEIEDGSAFCENCGWQVPKEETAETAGGSETVFCANCGAPMGAEDDFCTNCGWRTAVEEKKDKKSPFKAKGLKTAVCIAVPLLVAAAAIAVFAASGMNFIRRTFYSPEKYFRYTVEKEAEKLSGTLADVYDQGFRESFNIRDKGGSAAVTVRLGDDARDMLESAARAADLDALDDLEWLDQVGIAMDYSMKGEAISGNLALKLGKEELLSGTGIADMKGKKAYLQIPVLSDKYIGADVEELLEEMEDEMDGMDLFEFYDTVYESCPDKKTLEKLLNKYSALAVSCIEEVEKGSETIDAGGVSVKCTSLQTKIRAKTLRKMAETVLKEMKNDDEFKEILKKISKVEGLDDVYDDFRDGVDELLDHVDDIDFEGSLVWDLYLDKKGKVLGFQLKMGDVKLYSASLMKGKNIGVEVSLDADGEGFRLEGEGKVSGTKADMDFSVKIKSYYGSETVKFRVEDMRLAEIAKGNISGTIVIPLKEIDGLPGEIMRMVEDYELEIEVAAEGWTSSKGEIRLMEDKNEIAAVNFEVKRGAGKEADIPEKKNVVMIEDESDLVDWLQDIDTNRFIKHLKETSLPRDIVDEIEEAIDDAIDSATYMLGWSTGGRSWAADTPAAAPATEPAEEVPAEEPAWEVPAE